MRTTNVRRTLNQASVKFGIAVENLDFELKSYEAIYTNEKNQPIELFSDEMFLDNSVKIEQAYEIDVRKKRDFEISVKLHSDNTLTHVYATVSELSKDMLELSEEELFEKVQKEINKKALFHGFLIGLFDVNGAVQQIVDRLRLNEEVKHIMVFEALHPTASKDAQLHETFKQKQNIVNPQYISVLADEVLMSVSKHQIGTPGRNCKGEYIAVTEPIDYESLMTFGVDETNIKIIEDDKKIEYHSLIDGYVTFEQNLLRVRDTITKDTISLKNTGHLDLNRTSVEVVDSDDNFNSIGAGVTVRAKTVSTSSGIDSGVNIKATESVHIKGVTHLKSQIVSDQDTSIDIHKGNLISKNVEVNIIEGGNVNAKLAKAKKVTGGIVDADDIDFDTVYSNNVITAKKSLMVQKLQGNNNMFVIEDGFTFDEGKKVKQYQQNVASYDFEISKLKASAKALLEYIQKNSEQYNALVNDAKRFVAMKTPVPGAYKAQMEKYKKSVEEYKAISEKLTKIEAFIADEKKYIEEMQEAIYETDFTVYNVGVLDPTNTISFVKDKVEIGRSTITMAGAYTVDREGRVKISAALKKPIEDL